MQQQLEEAARRAEDLQQVQEMLAEQTGDEDAQENPESLADEQLLASDEMTALEDKMEEISDRMQELQQAPTSQMEQLNEQTQAKELPENMKQNAQQMQSGQMQHAKSGAAADEPEHAAAAIGSAEYPKRDARATNADQSRGTQIDFE